MRRSSRCSRTLPPSDIRVRQASGARCSRSSTITRTSCSRASRSSSAREAALGASDDSERFLRWREWSAVLRNVFRSADGSWIEIHPVLSDERRSKPSFWRQLFGRKKQRAEGSRQGARRDHRDRHRLVEIARVERLLASKGDHALRKLFTDAERAYALSRPQAGTPSRCACGCEGGGVQGAARHAGGAGDRLAGARGDAGGGRLAGASAARRRGAPRPRAGCHSRAPLAHAYGELGRRRGRARGAGSCLPAPKTSLAVAPESESR